MLALHYGLDDLWEAFDEVLDDAAHLGLVDERLVLVLQLLVELVVVLAGLLGLLGRQNWVRREWNLPWLSLR